MKSNLVKPDESKPNPVSAAWLVVHCGYCEKEMTKRRSYINFKLKSNRYNKLFCSQSCGANHQIWIRETESMVAK